MKETNMVGGDGRLSQCVVSQCPKCGSKRITKSGTNAWRTIKRETLESPGIKVRVQRCLCSDCGAWLFPSREALMKEYRSLEHAKSG